LFATHYFELTSLADTHDAIGNVHLDAVEHNDEIVFMHNVKSGAASKSYGLQVAKLAGLPAATLRDARQRLQSLENTSSVTIPSAPNLPGPQMGLFESEHQALADYLEDLNPDELSPRQALDHLYQLTKLARQ